MLQSVIWVILLFANGTAMLLFNQTLAGSVYDLALPAPPLSAPLVLNNGTPVPAVLNGSVLEVPVLGTALITVEYVPKVEAAGGILSFNVSDGLYLIWAQGGVLLLPALKVLNYTRAGGALLLVAQGPGTVAYTLQGTTVATSATQTYTSQTPGQPSTYTQPAPPPGLQTSASQRTSASGSPSAAWPLWLAVAAAVAVVAAVAALLLRPGRRGPPGLNDTDRLVLSFVERSGGAYESDIARSLGLPRTTVFKSVRRLEQAGLVSVEKRDGRNFVTPR